METNKNKIDNDFLVLQYCDLEEKDNAFDNACQQIPLPFKFMKWSKKYFFFYQDVCFYNGFVLYKQTLPAKERGKLKLWDFIENVAVVFMEMAMSQYIPNELDKTKNQFFAMH